MKTANLLLLVATLSAATLLSSGCASVNVTTNGNDLVSVQNSGCFLFYFVPLFSGDPDYPNQQVCNWFENTVTLETNMRLLNEEAARQGATGVRNLASHRDDEMIVWLLLKRKMYRTSAELVR